MTDKEKLDQLKIFLGDDQPDDARLAAYLDSAKAEIIAWRYGAKPESEWPAEVPVEYVQTQIWAVVAGHSQAGAENQTAHAENGISRTFKHGDMIAYIHANVRPYVGVL